MAASPSVAGLLNSFRAASGAPRLIWYGPHHERVELSGRVLENWVAKTSNLLVEELDAVEGSMIAVDMPPHWKSLVWALASWQVGAVTVLDTPYDVGSPDRTGSTSNAGNARVRAAMEAPADIGQTVTPDELLVLVAPGALDMRWPGTLPSEAVDYAATVRSFGDVYLDEPAGQGVELIRTGGSSLTFDDLTAEDVEQPGGIWLIPASLPLLTVLTAAVRIWVSGGTVVLVHPSVEVTDRLVEGERITARWAA